MSRDRLIKYCAAILVVVALGALASMGAPEPHEKMLCGTPLIPTRSEMLNTLAGFLLFVFWSVGLLVAAWYVPVHQPVKHLFRPPSLPQFRRSRGFTLIELLIVVAIVAVLMPPFVRLTAQGRIAAEREALSRESLALAEDELAWLRAQPALPAAGVHQIEPQVAALHKVVAPMARLEISQTSGPLVQARVHVDLMAKGIATPISIAALIGPRKEAKR